MNLGAVAAALVATDAGNKARRAIGDDQRVLEHLVGWLRRLVAADDPVAGIAALARLEEAPESHIRLHEFGRVLERRARFDGVFRVDLEALIDQARSDGVDIESITQVIWGRTGQPPG